MNIDTSRSYSTEENLVKALTKLGWHEHRHLVVCNRRGRFTAVFPGSNLQDTRKPYCGDLMMYARRGFMTLG